MFLPAAAGRANNLLPRLTRMLNNFQTPEPCRCADLIRGSYRFFHDGEIDACFLEVAEYLQGA
jgi:hypothetical protein